MQNLNMLKLSYLCHFWKAYYGLESSAFICIILLSFYNISRHYYYSSFEIKHQSLREF